MKQLNMKLVKNWLLNVRPGEAVQQNCDVDFEQPAQTEELPIVQEQSRLR
jgi:hypothetical protein